MSVFCCREDYLQLGNSLNIFTPGDVQNTNVACQHSQQTRDQCWSNSGPPTATLAQHKTSTGSMPRVCWLRVWQCKPTPTQCLLNVWPASPVLTNIHSTVVSRPTSCWLYYRHYTLNKNWVNVGPPSVMLAHIQRGDKHDTATGQYWANVG